MLQLTTAYVNQADREQAVEANLRTRHVLEAIDATPSVEPPVVSQRAAARPARTAARPPRHLPSLGAVPVAAPRPATAAR